MNDDENNQFIDMIGKIVVGFTSKFDGISERINEKTGWHIDVGKIVGVILIIIVVWVFVKAILGIVMGKLMSGNYD